MTSKSFVIFVVFTLANSVFSDNVNVKSDRSEFRKSLGKHCDDSYSLTCLKLDAISWVEKLSENDDISVLPGVSLVRENKSDNANNGDIVAELAREFPDDPNARLDGYLTKKITGLFDNHSIKLNLWKAVQSDSAGTARKEGGGGGGGGGGGKKGGDGGMGMAMAMGGMMKMMMLSAGLAAVALLAKKALIAALGALLLAGLALLKGGGGGGGGGHSTYEVISKPIYTQSHSHSTGHEGWDGGYGGHGRSFDHSLPLGLQPGYSPE